MFHRCDQSAQVEEEVETREIECKFIFQIHKLFQKTRSKGKPEVLKCLENLKDHNPKNHIVKNASAESKR